MQRMLGESCTHTLDTDEYQLGPESHKLKGHRLPGDARSPRALATLLRRARRSTNACTSGHHPSNANGFASAGALLARGPGAHRRPGGGPEGCARRRSADAPLLEEQPRHARCRRTGAHARGSRRGSGPACSQARPGRAPRPRPPARDIRPAHSVTSSQARPLRNIQTSAPPSLDAPNRRSTNTIGTSPTRRRAARARARISIWNAYPRERQAGARRASAAARYSRKDPVRSDACGRARDRAHYGCGAWEPRHTQAPGAAPPVRNARTSRSVSGRRNRPRPCAERICLAFAACRAAAPACPTPSGCCDCAGPAGRHPQLQQRGREHVRAAASQLPPEVPAGHAAARRVARAAHDVVAALRLRPDHGRDVLGLPRARRAVSTACVPRTSRARHCICDSGPSHCLREAEPRQQVKQLLTGTAYMTVQTHCTGVEHRLWISTSTRERT